MPENFPYSTSAEIGPDPRRPAKRKSPTFGSGCFWCTEAVFQQIKGVKKVESATAAGVKNPSYDEVCTGHRARGEWCRSRSTRR